MGIFGCAARTRKFDRPAQFRVRAAHPALKNLCAVFLIFFLKRCEKHNAQKIAVTIHRSGGTIMNQSTVIGGKLRAAFAAIALAWAAHGAVATESSQPATRAYSIPAGTLAEALTEFADQADLKLIFDADLTRGFQVPALRETVTVEQGLNKLLKDSGLSYRIAENNTTIIEPKPAAVETQPQSGATLPVVKVSDDAMYDPNDPYNPDYNRRNASTATKTNTPIMETPLSIQVVPKQVLQDQ